MDVMNNKGNMTHIFVITLYGDRWLLDILWYIKVQALCCAPESNVCQQYFNKI